MTLAQTVRCKACNGTGISDGRCKEPSQNALLRREVAKAWDMVAAHEQFLKSIYETSQEAITGLIKKVAKKDAKIAELQQIIGRMKSELGVYKDKMKNGDDDGVGKGSDDDSGDAPIHNNNNNGNELSIRDNVVIDRHCIAFPDAVGTYNFSVMKTVPPAKKKERHQLIQGRHGHGRRTNMGHLQCRHTSTDLRLGRGRNRTLTAGQNSQHPYSQISSPCRHN